jgi:Mg-chelatase subunit ChlD
MQFVHQPLTWAFLLALVPLLIHLINMMRHRRVHWAAMEFLLASYKKHRTWIWLKQLLLLLARMAAVILVVAMLAQPKTRDQWLAIFGGRVTHHFVVLDDSYSMSDRVAGASAMDAAKQVITAIVGRAIQEETQQKLTLVRYSQTRATNGEATPDDRAADFNAEPIDSNFDITLERRLHTFDATPLSVGPREALALLRQLLGQSKDETTIVYVLSDFRQKDWGSPAELREALGQLTRSQADVHLVNCSRSTEPNLGIVAIEPADETRAAGVPLFVNVKVKNFGTRIASKVPLKLQSTYFPPDDIAKTAPTAAETLKGQTEDLATLLIDQIGPAETITRRVQVYFPQPGKHVVEATLPEDPVETDNRRWCVIDFPVGERVLVIDSSPEVYNSAYFLHTAFRPLDRSNTGIQPDIQQPSFLRDATLETLNGYSAIYLLDVSRLDGRAVESLESYVQGGGGIAIFMGPEVNTAYYNQYLYKEGKGILPAPLGLEATLPPALDPSQPDVELLNHPIFSFFQSETNPLIRGVKVDRYRKVPDSWKPTSQDGVETIARLRDKSPLIVEKKLGQGEVILVLTTLVPEWNDWAKNPSFVVVALKMQSYLASAKRLDDPRLVGTPLDLRLESGKYLPDISFIVPGEKAGSRNRIEHNATPAETGSTTLIASLGRRLLEGRFVGETDRPGIYEAWTRTTKGDNDIRRWAINVDPDEGDLTPIESSELLTRLDPVKVAYHLADQYQQDEVTPAGYNLSTLVLCTLVLLLVAEQLFAYSASYHVAPGGVR